MKRSFSESIQALLKTFLSFFTKKNLVWIFAVLLTISAAIYQRLTGPTYPLRVKTSIGGNDYKFKLTRSFAGDGDCPIELKDISDPEVTGTLYYRIFPKKVEYTKVEMVRSGNQLSASLPHQNVAGKLEYKVTLSKGSQQVELNRGKSTVIRFRGDVPAFVMIPHILIMFLAMLFSNVAGCFALLKIPSRKMMLITMGTLFVGGLIMGPLVQKYAFNELWAGVPYGWDLTDNKTLIAFLAWAIAWYFNRKEESRYWIVFASIMTIAVFSIPHSLFGSQLDPETGKIIQGAVMPFIGFLF